MRLDRFWMPSTSGRAATAAAAPKLQLGGLLRLLAHRIRTCRLTRQIRPIRQTRLIQQNVSLARSAVTGAVQGALVGTIRAVLNVKKGTQKENARRVAAGEGPLTDDEESALIGEATVVEIAGGAAGGGGRARPRGRCQCECVQPSDETR